MLDLSSARTEGSGHLTKVTARRDGGNDQRLLFDIELAFEITEEEDADIVERTIPGALACWRLRVTDEDSQATYRRTLSDPSGHLQVLDVEGNSIDASSEIMSVQLKGTRAAMFLTLKARLFGLPTDEAIKLLDWLNGSVTVVLEKAQQVLSFPDSPVPGPTDAEIVAVPSDDGNAFGMVVFSKGSMLEITNFDSTQTVDKSSVVSRLKIRSGEGKTMAELIALYSTECLRLHIKPDWSHIIVALGEDPGSYDDDVPVITEQIITNAIDSAIAANDVAEVVFREPSSNS